MTLVLGIAYWRRGWDWEGRGGIKSVRAGGRGIIPSVLLLMGLESLTSLVEGL